MVRSVEMILAIDIIRMEHISAEYYALCTVMFPARAGDNLEFW